MKILRQTKMYILKCVSVFLVTLLFFCFYCSFSAFAYNDDYLDINKWGTNKNQTTINFTKESPFSSATGQLSYMVDPYEYSFYTYISVRDERISENAKEITVLYHIENAKEQYDFSVNQNNEIDCLSNELQYFNIYSNFNTYPATCSGDYLVAFDIDNGCDENLVSITLLINGSKYVLCNDILASAPIEAEIVETTKVQRENKTTTNKSKIEKTTKFENNKVYKIVTTKPHKYTLETKENSSNSYTTEYIEAEDEAVIDKSNGHLSKSSLLLLIIGIVIGSIALTLMLILLVLKTDKTDEEKEQKPIELEDNDEEDFDF